MQSAKCQNQVSDRCGRLVKIKSQLARLKVVREIRYLKQKFAEGQAESTKLKQSSQIIVARLNRSLNPETLAVTLERGSAMYLIRNEAAYRSICNSELELIARNLETLAEKAVQLGSEINFKTEQSCRHLEKEKACVKHDRTQRAQVLANLDSREQVEIEESFAQTICADGKLWAI